MRLALNAWFWDSPSTGSGQYTRQLVHALGDLGCDLEVVLAVPSPAWEGEALETVSLPASFAVHAVRCSRSNLGKVWFEQVAFPRACACMGADVAHVPYWGSPVRSRLPVVVTVHDLIPLLMPSYRGGSLQRVYTALVSAAARRAALVLTDSEASRRDILHHLALPQWQVRSIPLAVDTRYGPESDVGDAAIRARYGLPNRYVLYLGGFDRRKNLVGVFAAYRQATSVRKHDCALVIAGRLPEEDNAFTPDPRRLMREERVPDKWVHFSGFVEEEHKPAVYRAALAFLFPSRYEGFGLPPLEALACGTPVVGSNRGSLSETVGDGGILVPPDEVTDMADGLSRMVVDDDFRGRMRCRALAQASKFSWRRTAEATLAAYKDVRC